jgi:hypothetical protein
MHAKEHAANNLKVLKQRPYGVLVENSANRETSSLMGFGWSTKWTCRKSHGIPTFFESDDYGVVEALGYDRFIVFLSRPSLKQN